VTRAERSGNINARKAPNQYAATNKFLKPVLSGSGKK